MPDYVLAGLFTASFFLPTAMILAVAVYVRGPSRAFWATLGVMTSISINISLAYYTSENTEWWSTEVFESLASLAYILAVISLFIAPDIAAKLDREVDEQRKR